VSAAVVGKLAPETPRAPRRPRFSEDALVRGLDYCDESGLRFGQFLIAAVSDSLTEAGCITNGMHHTERVAVIERTAFYIENGALEEAMRKLIAKRRQEVQARVA
jgi:hypothetical protein